LRSIDPIRVLIADAHSVLRERLSRFLRQQNDIQVIGEAIDGLQVLRQVEALHPHILLLDLRMPKMRGLEVLPHIHAKSPGTKILIRAEYFVEDFIARALEGGAHRTRQGHSHHLRWRDLGAAQAADPGHG
jgi:DNA-binding NarL/FixJ family response regulator